MESAKENEHFLGIQYLNMAVIVCLSATLAISQAVLKDLIHVPFLGGKVTYFILKYHVFFETKLIVSLTFISLIFFAMQIPAKVNYERES